MQKINAAYEAIKDPNKSSAGSRGYDPFGGAQRSYESSGSGDRYQQAAYQYILYGRYREALNVLASAQEKNARWYYLSALANDGLGNQVTALEHIRRAVSLEPDNMQYLQTLSAIENGGATYRRQAGNFRGFDMRGNLWQLCLCWLFQLYCCRGRIFCC